MVGRLDLEDALDRAVGGHRIAERSGIEIGQHFKMTLALGLVFGDANQRFQRARPLGVVLGQLVVRCQAASHRRHILGANGVGGEHALQALDRAACDVVEFKSFEVGLGRFLVLAQIALVDLAQPKQGGGAIVLGAERGLARQHRGQAAKIPLLFE